jgi:hypothetical protein
MSDVTTTTEAPAANSPEARTPDGTLKDVSPGVTTTPTDKSQTPAPAPDSSTKDLEGSTFLTGKKTEAEPKAEGETKPETKPDAPQGAPEKYTDFKLPDGYEFDPKAKTAFETTAKELNLTQDGAQKLINIWAEHAAQSARAPYDLWADTQRQWHTEIESRFGGADGAAKMSAGINAAINNVLPPSLQKSFRAALDFTGAGSNPDLLEGLSILLKPHMEARPVPGGRPNDKANTDPGQPRGPIDPAAAMYPHLVKNRPT